MLQALHRKSPDGNEMHRYHPTGYHLFSLRVAFTSCRYAQGKELGL